MAFILSYDLGTGGTKASLRFLRYLLSARAMA